MVALVFLFLGTATINWIAEELYRVYFWFVYFVVVVVLMVLLVFTPIVAIKKTRSIGLVCMFVSSYIFGVNCWLLSLIVGWLTLGAFWVLVGLAILGVGVLPVAIVGCVIRHTWTQLWSILFNLALMVATRLIAVRLSESTPSSSPHS